MVKRIGNLEVEVHQVLVPKVDQVLQRLQRLVDLLEPPHKKTASPSSATTAFEESFTEAHGVLTLKLKEHPVPVILGTDGFSKLPASPDGRAAIVGILRILFNDTELALIRTGLSRPHQIAIPESLKNLGISSYQEPDPRRWKAAGVLLEHKYRDFNFLHTISQPKIRESLNRFFRSLSENKELVQSIAQKVAQLKAQGEILTGDQVVPALLHFESSSSV